MGCTFVMICMPSDRLTQVLELGMNFLSAEDMSVVLAMQLHKSVGLGMTANMHLTRMHVEGKASHLVSTIILSLIK